MLLAPGDRSPTFILDDIATGEQVTNPWTEGPTVVTFFKVTCPVCQLVAPKVQALADAGARVTAIGEDPAPALTKYAERFGQRVPTVTEPPPYRVSSAYGVTAVPTVFLVDQDGVVQHAVGGWDRQRWNAVAAAVGAPPLSADGDGLPSYRPG
ncbi:MAG: TlpA family protein disulfide reductase [Acidimicrobiales bacterium]